MTSAVILLSRRYSKDRRNLGSDSIQFPENKPSLWTYLLNKKLQCQGISIYGGTKIDVENNLGKMCKQCLADFKVYQGVREEVKAMCSMKTASILHSGKYEDLSTSLELRVHASVLTSVLYSCAESKNPGGIRMASNWHLISMLSDKLRLLC